jgi:hypothetical protein
MILPFLFSLQIGFAMPLTFTVRVPSRMSIALVWLTLIPLPIVPVMADRDSRQCAEKSADECSARRGNGCCPFVLFRPLRHCLARNRGDQRQA